LEVLTFSIKKPTHLRLDQFLSKKGIAPSRSQISKWIEKGCIKLNQKVTKASVKLKPGDEIQVIPPQVIRSPKLIAEKIPLNILYEDNDLIVVDKSAQMVVHPGAGHKTGTLAQALIAHCGKLSQIGGVERPGLVHRLDKGTSGVMVIAKNDRTHLDLSEQFKNHNINKIYWALVYGKMKQKKGRFKSLITRSRTDRKKFSISKTKGKEAITDYRVLKEGEGLSLIQINLHTGRTHQIRVHLTHDGHSIVGDPVYGGASKKGQTD